MRVFVRSKSMAITQAMQHAAEKKVTKLPSVFRTLLA
jgi:ribosome-associated translation inhibitor RaiA